MSRINDASLNQIGGAVQLYKYEPFSQFLKVSPTYSGTSLSFTASSPQLFSFLSNVDVSTIAFSSVNGPSISSSGLSLVVNAISNASTVETKTYTVNIGAGRFTNPPSNYPFVFYKNEPIGTNASSLFVSSIPNISKPVSTTSLPAGIGFVYNDICSYYLTGTPLITYPQSNYNIIASDASSRTINIPINIKVNPERVIMDNSGASTVTGAAIDTQITPLSVVGRAPPYTTGILSYTWSPSLPDGLRFTNSAGTTLTNGAVPTDASSTIILKGAITSAGIKTLSSANLNIRVTGTRTFTPTISSYVDLSVNFEESVVFDVPTVSGVYKDASFTYTSNYNTFRAYTLFADASITSMTASSLPTGVYLDFSSNAQRGYLVGTPTAIETCNATITATNANAKTRDISATISVSNDSITFSTFPSSSTFIIGRSLSSAKSGYYSSPLTFTATSGSGCNVTMSMSGLTGTGLSFTGTSGSTATYTLSGRPTNVKALSSVTVSAEVTATSRTGTSNYSFEIVPDVFTFSPDPSLVLIQNIEMTPVDISAGTLSGLPIIQYTSTNIPNGLTMSANGRISGTPTITDTSGTFTVFATTGYTSDTCTYTFSLTRDAILLFAPQPSYTYDAGANVSIQISGLAYSGGTVSNYQFKNLPDSGLTIGSTSGLITGPLTDSVPPNPVLPAGSTPFDICGGVGLNFGSLPGTFTTINPISKRMYVFMSPLPTGGAGSSVAFTKDVSNLGTLWDSNKITLDGIDQFGFNGQMSEFRIKNTSVDSNVFLATYTDPSGGILRSTNGINFSRVYVDASATDPIVLSSLVNKPGTSTWFAGGTDEALGPPISNVYLWRSDDDGIAWTVVDQISITGGVRAVQPRDFGTPPINNNAYLTSGTTLGYKDGVLLAGGAASTGKRSILRSEDEGVSWSQISSSVLTTEIARFNLDTSRWIATGSQFNNSGGSHIADGNTIMYSDDNGSNWTAATGGFNHIGYDIAYGDGTWIATGLSYYTAGGDNPVSGFYEELRVSSNGSVWTDVSDIGVTRRTYLTTDLPTYPLQIGKPFYVSNAWNIVAQETAPAPPPSIGSNYYPALCTHQGTTDLSTNWTKSAINFTDTSFTVIEIPAIVGYNEPQYVRTGNPTQARLDFTTTTVGGPTFTSPTQTSYLLYQYMPITPITFSVTGSGNVYFFLQTEDLPTGLVWNPYTATITGKSVELGKASFTVYAKDASGVSSTVIQTETIIPRVVRQQTSAGAYTYLLKQYTEVLGAQASRDKKALPDEDSTLGKFMGPPAPDVMSASNTCGCPTK